jgi:hypothetical protein
LHGTDGREKKRRTKTVTKWDEWERVHAEQDARDKKIGILVLLLILVLALVIGVGGAPGING